VPRLKRRQLACLVRGTRLQPGTMMRAGEPCGAAGGGAAKRGHGWRSRAASATAPQDMPAWVWGGAGRRSAAKHAPCRGADHSTDGLLGSGRASSWHLKEQRLARAETHNGLVHGSRQTCRCPWHKGTRQDHSQQNSYARLVLCYPSSCERGLERRALCCCRESRRRQRPLDGSAERVGAGPTREGATCRAARAASCTDTCCTMGDDCDCDDGRLRLAPPPSQPHQRSSTLHAHVSLCSVSPTLSRSTCVCALGPASPRPRSSLFALRRPQHQLARPSHARARAHKSQAPWRPPLRTRSHARRSTTRACLRLRSFPPPRRCSRAAAAAAAAQAGQ
jgi:hypothetical protein